MLAEAYAFARLYFCLLLRSLHVYVQKVISGNSSSTQPRINVGINDRPRSETDSPGNYTTNAFRFIRLETF